MSTPTLSPGALGSHLSLSPASDGAATPSFLIQNSTDPDAPWIVQKFGGTTVGKFAAKIADDALAGYIQNYKLAIVCSARSGSTKALGTTNLLLKAATEALSARRPIFTSSSEACTPLSTQWAPIPPFFSPASTPRGSEGHGMASSSITQAGNTFDHTVDLIRSEHLTSAKSLIRDPILLKQLEDEIINDTEVLRKFLEAAQVIEEISPRSKDCIIGSGERMACKLVAAVLRDRGIDSEFVSLENIVPKWDDIEVLADETLGQVFYDRLPEVLAQRIKQCGSRVPVITGFFSPVPGSLLRQIGRGYTDLLSALVAVGLQASELQIWKEVDGIFTADPRKVPTARLIPSITPEEAAELTYYGSEVVHPFTMEQVISKSIPIRIKNIGNAKGTGTLIQPPSGNSSPTSDLSAVTKLSLREVADQKLWNKLPTAVTIKENIVVINITSNRKNVSHGFLARIFGILDKHGLIVDLISTSEVHVSMAAENRRGNKALDRLLADFGKLGKVTTLHEMVILSLVGRHMRNMVGIAGRMFSTLAEGKVNIEMISQGASEINISCVIDGRDAIKALNIIHQSCLEVTRAVEPVQAGPWLF